MFHRLSLFIACRGIISTLLFYWFDMKNLESNNKKIAVLIPCYNEEAAIQDVIESFKEALPHSSIYIYDNNSTDNTIAVAKACGAIVYTEKIQGKGAVVRRMFADIEADIYIMADGDGTYDAASAPHMVNKLSDENLDMLVGTRLSTRDDDQFPLGHHFGNRLFTKVVGMFFGQSFGDILSGYRIFSRRFVKTFPAMSDNFEIETELTIHALEMKLACEDYETPYYARAIGTESKLSTFTDGYKILKTIIYLLKELKPFLFFGVISFILCCLSLGLAWPLAVTYIETGLVPRFPTAILSTGIMLMSFLSLSIGVILDSVRLSRWEMKRLHYLALKK